MISVLATLLMTRAHLGPKLAKATAWGIVLLLAALALWWAYNHAYSNGKHDERAKWEAASAKVIAADLKADAEGVAVAADTQKGIDDVTDKARDDARNSPDPLDAIARRLREEGAGRGGEAPR